MQGFRIVFTITFLMASGIAIAQENVLHASFRSRPPEMQIDEKTKTFSGPLRDILEEAAQSLGYKVSWTEVPFSRSLKYELEEGKGSDIVPRVLYSDERRQYVEYLGPIGYQQKDIFFLVKKGQEELLNTYDDLKKIVVGAKRGTVYFKKFDEDASIQKILALDDKNMVHMFEAGRFDAMIVLDKEALEAELKNNHITAYSFANYKYVQKIGNYFAMSKKSKVIALAPKLNQALLDMVKSGRVLAIYNQYHVAPPVDDFVSLHRN